MIWQSARELARLMRQGELSAVEVMSAHYDRLEAVNPKLNAIVNLLDRDRALAKAREADRRLADGQAPGLLHGLPMAPKDLVDAVGFPTTCGFIPFADRMAKKDSLVIARQRAAGAIFIGKTNTPEFGLGSHTFNRLFGPTGNPFDPSKSAGGSSGGAAAAVASGMLPIADGSDMGGSLRNPASFCGVVGLRPSIGRVPSESAMGWFARLDTPGPLARNVADAALLLAVQAGPDEADPLALSQPGEQFLGSLDGNPADWRIAFTADLGFLPVDAEVKAACRAAASVFGDLGCRVTDDCPDLSTAMDIFQIQRAAKLRLLGQKLDRETPGWREHAKDTLLWNVDQGRQLDADALLRAEQQRTLLYALVAEFFREHDALILPAAQVPPFDIDTDWVREVDGKAMSTYLEWMTVCCAISVTGLPSISVPCGYTVEGLPIGLQIVGKPRGDFELLKIANAFEQAMAGSIKLRPQII